jgi:predicted nucleic acid-binding protein
VTVVVDASMALAWLIEDEQSDAAESLRTELIRVGGLAPSGWPLEVANALLVAERRRRIHPERTASVLEELRKVPIRVANAPHEAIVDATLAVARYYNLTVYDAAYLELAIRERATIATLDDALGDAARRAGVAVFGG